MKHPLAAASAALALTTPLTAQTSVGIRAGMTLSSFATSDEQIEQSSITGTQFGVTATFMGERAGLLLSTTYTQRGAGFESGRADFAYKLDYLEIGALGKVPFAAGLHLLAGPTLGLRAGCSVSASDPSGRTEKLRCPPFSDEDLFKSYDFGVSGGAGVSFDAGGFDLVAEAVYTLGIPNILTEVPDFFFKNRGFAFRAGMDVHR